MAKKALEFLIWLRDEVGVIRHSKEGNCLDPVSNGELRRWLKKGNARVNGEILSGGSTVMWPITDCVLFPNNARARVTLV